MKVALVYDRVNKWGGAERVLLVLHELFPEAPLYTSGYDKHGARWAKPFQVITSSLRRVPFTSSHHEMFPYLMPFAFEQFTFDDYDLVISVTSEAAKGIITKPETKHVCICLTPTRYLWSGYEEYFSNPFFRFITKPIVWYLKTWDLIAAQRPDFYIAISQEVRARIKKYYGRDSQVIYPAVSLGEEEHVVQREDIMELYGHGIKPSEDGAYFLVVSRLVSYKKVNLAVNVCTKLGLPLKVVGRGSDGAYLRDIAGPTVEFVSNLTDDELIEYYKGCKALLFPGYEDLGLSIIEAQRCGRPVIAYKKGGALETIVEGKTGKFFFPQTEKALQEAIESFLQENKVLSLSGYRKKYEAVCRENAEQFHTERFKSEIRAFIDQKINR